MTTKHTPGPWGWTHDSEPYSDQWTLSPGVMLVDGSDGTPGGDEIDRANARLIAAAPDLLEALKEALEAHDYPGREGWTENARAAIAKAEDKT